MVNLWGPGAFDSLNPSASRPVFVPDNAPGDVDDWFKDCSSPLVADGTEWRSALLNLLIANMRSVVTGSGTAKSNLDDALLARAIQSGGMNWAAATGTANNWTIALNQALAAYRAGLPLQIKPPATNTSTTVVATIDGLASRPVKKADGTDPAIGDLVAGRWYPTFDDGTNIRVLATLPSDIAPVSLAAVAANKSPFNVVQIPFTARTSLSGTGFVTYQTGSYTKKSATSELTVSLHADGYAAGTAAAIARVTFGANTLQTPFSNSTVGQTGGGANCLKVFTGVAAGALSWTWAFGRGDATAWVDVINPTSTDVSYLPSETVSFIMFQEKEP
jgi:hypothetical protein